MPTSRPTRPRLAATLGLLATLLLLAPGLTPAQDDATPRAQAKKAQAKKAQGKKANARGKKPGADIKADAPAKADRAEALATLRDLRELAASAREDGRGASPEADADADSPEALRARLGLAPRVVEAPTLTPDDIDRMLAAHLKDEGVAPAKLASDEDFLRRASLDLAGKLPEPDAVLAFARDDDPRKRAKLIDRLLDSDDFARNFARYWRDVIGYRATFEQRFLVHYESLEAWLADQVRADRPWDEIARAMIAGTGSSADPASGNVVLAAAHNADPAEFAGEVSRIFLGVQIACAQCHDHPTDPWKREQFHQFAAFFAGTRARRSFETVDGRRINTGLTIAAQGRPRYTMPDLDDPTKSIPVEPRFFLAPTEEPVPADLTAQRRRELAALYVTGQDNPWFAKAFVNRAWYTLMGEAFYDPVDDMGPARDPIAPELLDRLSAEFARSGYDVKWLYRTLLRTRAYQRQDRSTRTEAGRTSFAAACPSRLRADQILDALEQALGFDLEAAAEKALRRRVEKAASPALAALYRRGANGTRTLFNTLFAADPSVPNDEVLGTIPQALFLMNSPLVNRAIAAGRGSMLADLLAAQPDDRAALDALYLRVLSRRPTDAEARTCAGYLAQVGDRREAFEDILWALVNSTEFISRR
jgi:hypothetical protein